MSADVNKAVVRRFNAEVIAQGKGEKTRVLGRLGAPRTV
ncbi:hypothetical protein BH10PSE3_BH10PSE3_39270 [soil metagenome]